MDAIKNSRQVELVSRVMRDLISRHAEWFLTQTDNSTQAIRREELDVRISHDRLILSSWTEKGTCAWKINSWELNGDKLVLQTSRRMGRDRASLELIPRASASA